MSKYEKWYNNIVAMGLVARPTIRTTRHHIIPESFFKNRTRKGPPGWLDGNPEDTSNFTVLTGREHFICHWLLTKIYSGEAKAKMIYALRMMRAGEYHTNITARVYANIKEEYSKIASENMSGENNPMWNKTHTEEAKDKIRQANLGNQINEEQRKKISDSKLGKKRAPFSDEWIANIKAARHGELNGMYGKNHSEETRKKQSEKAKGRKYSAATIEKRAAKIRGSKREKLLCPYCNKDVAVNGYARWHGNNCKLKGPK